MYQKVKRFFYFAVAWYFRLFASVRLKIWNPRIIVITGSVGKTTLLHLTESQLGEKAKYSHHANSSIGIPFDILDLKREKLTFDEWPLLFIKAPFMIFTPTPKEKIYIVEADCDRPYEGDFISSMLNPEVAVWVSVSKTHSMGFENQVENGKFNKIEDAIAHEFGYFAERAKKLLIINADNSYEVKESARSSAEIEKISANRNLKKYELGKSGTKFVFTDFVTKLPYLVPKETAAAILMCQKLIEYLGFEFDPNFSRFEPPPARSSLFKGIKNITIIDSTYNANLDSMTAIISMFSQIPGKNKWIVAADMLEQGKFEKEEHEKLANVINNYSFEKIVLMGPRISKYTLPLLKQEAVAFFGPKEVLDYVRGNIKGGEIILFKGARFLEGVIENLLADKKDSAKLSRREKIWEIRRKKWGL